MRANLAKLPPNGRIHIDVYTAVFHLGNGTYFYTPKSPHFSNHPVTSANRARLHLLIQLGIAEQVMPSARAGPCRAWL